ncbi:MAG: hypothetical protein SynsKO_22650 [Synoicihabitans sp.]
MLSRLITPLANFFRRPVSDWWLLIEAMEILIWSKIQLCITPFSRLAVPLGTPQAETLQRVSESHREQVSKISWAVQAVARYLPLRLVCLPQAMAASVMLNRRAIDSTLYLGVKMDQANALTAHAWLRSGIKWVTGADARRGQTIVACFANIRPPAQGIKNRIRLLVIASIFTILAALTLMPTPPLHDITWQNRPDWIRGPIHTVGSNDIWFNLAGFIAASLIFNFSLYGRLRAPLRYRWIGAVFFILILIVLECTQLLLPGRNFDLFDIGMMLLAMFAVFPFWIKFKP